MSDVFNKICIKKVFLDKILGRNEDDEDEVDFNIICPCPYGEEDDWQVVDKWVEENWGPSSNAYYTEVKKNKDKKDLVNIIFYTRYCPPLEWLEKLSKVCPFYFMWEGEDNGEAYYDGKKFKVNIFDFDEKAKKVAKW